MTGSKHNLEGNSSDRGEPDPGPYWRRMHRDWRFWVGAFSWRRRWPSTCLVAIWRGFQMATGNRRCLRVLRIDSFRDWISMTAEHEIR